MGHKIPYLSSLLVTCHLSSRLYGVLWVKAGFYVTKITCGFVHNTNKLLKNEYMLKGMANHNTYDVPKRVFKDVHVRTQKVLSEGV